MKKIFFTFVFFMSLFLGIDNIFAQAQEDNEYYFKQGKQYFLAQDYDNALNMFKKIISRGKENGNVYYNIGNCYFRKKDYGHTMLYYLKAQKLMPQDVDLAYNIEFVKKTYVKDEIESRENLGWVFINKISDFLNCKIWFVFVSIFYVLFFILFFVWFGNKQRYSNLRQWMAIVGITCILFGVFGLNKYYRDYYLKYVVVISDKVDIKSGPALEFEKLFSLHSGIKARMMHREGAWARIRLANGLEGWIPVETVEVV